MPGFQPRHDTDPVWFGDTQVNNLLVASAQTGVRITAIHGWDDRPEVRDVRELRSGQDGEYADNLYLGGRTITVEGEVYGSSWADLQARKRSLAALFQPSSSEEVLKVPDPASFAGLTVWSASGMTGYERSSLRVVEAIQFGDTLDPACQEWQVILRASDPRVYSDVAVSTDSGTSGTGARTVAVDQGGSYETPPTLTVTGPTGSAFTISEPSGGLSLTMDARPLLALETATIDMRERTIDILGSYESPRLLDSGNVALWMLDEPSGTTADNDEGTAARDLTYTGGFTLNQSGHGSGFAAVELNGSTGYLTRAYNADMNTATQSIEMWAYIDSLAATRALFATGAANLGWGALVTASGALQMFRGTGSSFASNGLQTAGGVIAAGEWTHLVMVRESTGPSTATFRAFVNGVLVWSNSRDVGAAAGSGSFDVGRSTLLGGTVFMDGRVDSVALFDRALSSAEALEYYEASADAATTSGYRFLAAQTARWANLGTGSSTFTLSSDGLNTGSKLNVAYRDARV